MITSEFRRLVTVEFGEPFKCGIDEDKIDWLDVQGRIGEALQVSGTDFKDLCAFIGIDPKTGDVCEQVANLPKMRTVLAIAGFLGVSISWLLTGRGQPPYEKKTHALTFSPTQGIIGTTDSTVVQGNQAGTLIVNGQAETLSAHKKELNRIFDSLSLRNQTKLLSIAYEIEDSERSA